MAEKRLRSEGPAYYVAKATFYHNGNVLVLAGHTVEAGHALLRGKAALFAPFEPTWPLSRRAGEVAAAVPEPEPGPDRAPEPEPDPEPGPDVSGAGLEP